MTFSRDRRFTPVSGTRIPIYDGINGNSQDGYLPSSAWLRIVETKLKPDKKNRRILDAHQLSIACEP
ncbi:hypothetical protein LRY60_00155 [Candidatus Woesebacteria bacterium]|nr:hypothetical protein [Candidatus Woesebacteria bacterium]